MIDLNKLVASVGFEAESGILNDLEGVHETLQDLWNQDPDLAEILSENQAQETVYEIGRAEVLAYAKEYSADPQEMDELIDKLETLKNLAGNHPVTWVTWGVETDVSLGFIHATN